MQISKRAVLFILSILIIFIVVFTLGSPSFSGNPSPASSAFMQPTSPALDSVRFAVIGDYGWDTKGEADVSNLVHNLSPDLIITVGDNNCPSGSAGAIDQKIGKYYHDYIYPYKGTSGKGADVNRFFPTLGNHDWALGIISPYLDYFTLPNNERYYDFMWGPVHFFALDSDFHEPDGIHSTSVQATWLKEKLRTANETWKIVFFHHSPYSSDLNIGSDPEMQWPFYEWGATAVLSGHAHDYERLLINNTPYFVNGIGGGSIYKFSEPVPESEFRYNENHGAMLVSANKEKITFELYDEYGVVNDEYTILNYTFALPGTGPSNTVAEPVRGAPYWGFTVSGVNISAMICCVV